MNPPKYIIDGDMPPLAETGTPGLLPTDQSIGAPKGDPGQIYASIPQPQGMSVASGAIPVAAGDVQELEAWRLPAWASAPWLKWGVIGVIAGAAGRYGYHAWKKGRR